MCRRDVLSTFIRTAFPRMRLEDHPHLLPPSIGVAPPLSTPLHARHVDYHDFVHEKTTSFLFIPPTSFRYPSQSYFYYIFFSRFSLYILLDSRVDLPPLFALFDMCNFLSRHISYLFFTSHPHPHHIASLAALLPFSEPHIPLSTLHHSLVFVFSVASHTPGFILVT